MRTWLESKNLAFFLSALLCACAVSSAAGTLIVCDDEVEPRTLDPQRQFSEKNHTLLQQIYDGLYRFDPLGKIVPALAESEERIEGGLRLHLRKGVLFHDGRPFTAQAVQYTFERYQKLGDESPARNFLEHIQVEVEDAYTVKLLTPRFPDGLLQHRLAAFVLIVPPGTDAQELITQPVGTGAFRFAGRDPGKAVYLTANKDYWQKDWPRLDALTFRFVPAEEQVALLLKGEVDLVTELPGTLTGQVQEGDKTRVIKQKTYWTVGALINNAPGTPLADIRVRKALNHALDREDLIRYDVRGNGSVLATLTMPGEGGHNEELRPYRYDLDLARRLLAEAGVKPPLKLRAHVRAQSVRAAKIIASHLSKIGVELDLHVFSDAEVLESLQASTQHWDIGIAGIPDPMCHSYFIQSILLYSKSPYSLTNDAQFDRRLEAMASTVDQPERDRLGRELDRYVHEQALSLFTYQKNKTFGLHKGVEFTPYVSGMPYFFDASVDRGQD